MAPKKRWGATRETPLAREDFDMKDFPLKQALGKGGFANISMRETADHGVVAMKMIPLGKDGEVPRSAIRELAVRNMVSPHIVGVCMAGFARSESVPLLSKTPDLMVLTMDVAYGSMTKLVKESIAETRIDPFPSSELCALIYQIVKGVAYMHGHLVINGDFKLDNLLIMGHKSPIYGDIVIPKIEISDFGLCHELHTVAFKSTRSGTLRFFPPEYVFMESVWVSYASDMWSLGCTLYELATGSVLFTVTHKSTALEEMRTGILGLLGLPPKSVISNQYAAFWRPEYSITFGSTPPAFESHVVPRLAQYPGLANLLKRMLMYSPAQRCTAAEALADPYFTQDVREFVDMHILEDPSLKHYIPLVQQPRSTAVDPATAIRILNARESQCFRRPSSSTMSAEWLTTSNVFLHVCLSHNSNLVVVTHGLALIRELAAAGTTNLLGGVDSALVATACHRIAMKYCSEIKTPTPEHYASFVGKPQTSADISKTERSVLRGLDFDVSIPSGYNFLLEYQQLNNLTTIEVHVAFVIYVALHLDPLVAGTALRSIISTMSISALRNWQYVAEDGMLNIVDSETDVPEIKTRVRSQLESNATYLQFVRVVFRSEPDVETTLRKLIE